MLRRGECTGSTDASMDSDKSATKLARRQFFLATRDYLPKRFSIQLLATVRRLDGFSSNDVPLGILPPPIQPVAAAFCLP